MSRDKMAGLTQTFVLCFSEAVAVTKRCLLLFVMYWSVFLFEMQGYRLLIRAICLNGSVSYTLARRGVRSVWRGPLIYLKENRLRLTSSVIICRY